MLHARLLQQVHRQRGGIHHCGDADGNHRHPQRLLVQRRTVVPHAGAGDDAGVAQLHRGAHPAHPPGGQGVHRDDHGRLHLLHQAPHRLGGLHSRGAQHAGALHRHRAEPGKVLGHGGDQVPGDEDAVRRQRPHRVRRHGPVPQAHHQRRPLRRQQRLELAAHRPDRPLKKIRLALPEGGKVDGEVAAPGLAQGLLAPFIQNLHPGHRIALLLALDGLDPRKAGGPLRGLLPQFPGLQRQIRAFYEQKAPLPDTKSCGCGPRFCIRRHNIQKVNGNCKKKLAF